MFVHVSSHGVVSLEAREDFRAFELRSELQGEALAHALHGVAERDGQGFAWVLAGWLEEQLTQQPPSPGWRQRRCCFPATLLSPRPDAQPLRLLQSG